MSLRSVAPWLLLAGALSVSLMVLGAGRGDQLMTGLSAATFALAIVATALRVNAPAWRAGAADLAPATIGVAIRRNVWLAAVLYTWGSAALLAIYTLSGLTWRHGLQYGSGAALFAAGLAGYAWWWTTRKQPHMPPPALNWLHAGAALGGLAYLVLGGKLETARGDWAANDVFLYGGLALVALCALTAITQSRHRAPL